MLIDILVERSPTRRRVLTELLFRANLVAVDGTDSLAHWVLVERSPTRWRVLAELLSRASLVAVDGANSLAPWALVDLLVDGVRRCDAAQI